MNYLKNRVSNEYAAMSNRQRIIYAVLLVAAIVILTLSVTNVIDLGAATGTTQIKPAK